MTSMAPDLDSPRSSAGNALLPPPPPRATPNVTPPSRPGAPSGPPLRRPGGDGPNAWSSGPPRIGAAPIATPDPPRRRCRLVALLGTLAVVALVGAVAYVAFDADRDERAAGTDPTTTAVPATFAVDLSTGADDDAPAGAAAGPAPTLPLPSISLPMPGASPVATTGVTTVAPGVILPAGVPPENLGDDSVLDGLAGECYAGDMAACDELFFAAEVGTAYLAYGDTCAGRQPEHTTLPCADTFAHATSTTIG